MSDFNRCQQQQPHASTYSIVSGPMAPVDDFLTQHLGQLLTRQPISPKTSAVTASPGAEDGSSVGSLPGRLNQARSVRIGSISGSLQSAHTRSASEAQGMSHAMVASNSRNSIGSLADPFLPACDDLFASFFASTSINRAPSTTQQSRDGASVSSLNSDSRGPPSQRSGSVSMSTSFGVRRKSLKSGSTLAVSEKAGTTSNSASSTSEQPSLFLPSYGSKAAHRRTSRQHESSAEQRVGSERQQSHTSSRSHSQPSSVETAPTTPPDSNYGSNSADGVIANKVNTRWIGSNGVLRRTSSGATSPGSEEMETKNRAAVQAEDAPTTINTSADESLPLTVNQQLDEDRKLKNFREGGVVEPPETVEGSCIQRSDMRKSKTGGKIMTSSSSNSSGAKKSRHTSMISSAFQPDYFSSAYLQARCEGGSQQGDSNRGSCSQRSGRGKGTSSGATSKLRSVASSSGRKAARIISEPLPEAEQSPEERDIAEHAVKLVPVSDDGRTFRFVSRASLQDDTIKRTENDGSPGHGKSFTAIGARTKSLC